MEYRFEAKDLGWEGLFTAYLDDTYWTWDESAFDSLSRRLSITGWRIRYESLSQRRAWGLFAVTECGVVPASLVIENVVGALLDPVRTTSKRGLRFEVAELSGSELTLQFDGGRIKATLESWAPLALTDIGPPSPRSVHSFWGRRYSAALTGLAAEVQSREAHG